MSGIYAGDGDQLSLAATFPYLRDLELKYGGLVKGVLAMKRQPPKSEKPGTGWRSVFLTPETGLSEIVEALVKYLTRPDIDLFLNKKLVEMEPIKNGYRVRLDSGDQIEAKSVILAAPAYESGILLNKLDAELGECLAGVPYITTATVSMAFRESDLSRSLNGYGYVIPAGNAGLH